MKQLKIKQKILVIFLCGMSVFTAQAQGQQHQSDTLVLTLPDALTIALSESPMVRIADREIQRVDYSRKSAWINLMPSLDATGQYAHFLKPATMAMMGQIMDSPTKFNAQMGLQLSLPLFAPALWHSIQMTTLDMQLAVERAHASRITLRNDVTKAFYGVLLAQDSHRTLQGTYALAEEFYQQAKKRFELGLGSEFDAVSAEVQMLSLQPTILEIEIAIEQTMTMLKILLGLDIAQPIAINGNLADYETDIENVNAILNFSVENNSDLRQLDIQQQQLQKALAIQRTQRMPVLAAFGTYGYAGMGNRATTINFGGLPIQVEESSDWFSQGLLVGVQLNIPLTGIFTNTARERQTKIQIEQLNIQREFLEHSLNMQVQTALSNMSRAIQQIEAAKRSQDLAQRGYDIALKRYEVGAGAFIEIQNALQSLTQTQFSYNQAITNYLNTKADLEKLLGESGF